MAWACCGTAVGGGGWHPKAQREQMGLTYIQAIQRAFRDVSNGLIGYRKNREFRIQQEHLLESAQDAARLSEVRFKAGTTDYLEVLTNETNSFSAALGLAQAQANEFIALDQIHQAMGGGWQQQEHGCIELAT